MNAVLEQLSKFGVVPVVVLNDVKDAEPIGKSTLPGWTSMCRSNFPY